MDVSRRIWLGRMAALFVVSGFPARAAAQDGSRPTVQIRIQRRKVVEPAGGIRITEGESVELHWTSDEAVSLHIHGYDIEVQIQPGAPSVTVIDAHATGRYPVTSHGWGKGGHGHEALTYLEVYPR